MPLVEIPEFEEDLSDATSGPDIVEPIKGLVGDDTTRSTILLDSNDKIDNVSAWSRSDDIGQEVIDLLDAETQRMRSPNVPSTQLNRHHISLENSKTIQQRFSNIRANSKGTLMLKKADLGISLKGHRSDCNNENLSKQQSRDTGVNDEEWIEFNDSKSSSKRGMRQQSLMLHFQPLKFARRNK